VEGASYKGTAMPSSATHNLSCLGRSSSELEVRNRLSWLLGSFGFLRVFSFIATVDRVHGCVAVATLSSEALCDFTNLFPCLYPPHHICRTDRILPTSFALYVS